MKSLRAASTVALVAVALAAAGCGGGDEEGAAETETTTMTTTGAPPPAGTSLKGTVGPGFEIRLTTADGQDVSTLAPGTYELVVDDLADIHNFHLTGPGGVDVATTVGDEGTQTFEVTLEPGTYTFVCDPHASSMHGSFEVG